MKYILLGLVVACFHVAVVGQKFTNIVGVSDEGDRYVLVSGIEQRALLDAQKNAAKSFGIGERVYELFDVLPYEQVHCKTVFEAEAEALEGIVNVNNRKYKSSSLNGSKCCEAVISGTVNKVKKVKRYLKMMVTGLQDVYYNGDFMTFNVKVDGDSYIHAYVFDVQSGWRLYPLQNEPFESIKAGVAYNYPLDANTKIFLEKSNVRNKVEHNTVVIVATTNPVQYEGEPEFGLLVEWLYSIPWNERAVCLRNVEIR